MKWHDVREPGVRLERYQCDARVLAQPRGCGMAPAPPLQATTVQRDDGKVRPDLGRC
jgi:hypothetical protein